MIRMLLSRNPSYIRQRAFVIKAIPSFEGSCERRISFATDDPKPYQHCAQETHSPAILDR